MNNVNHRFLLSPSPSCSWTQIDTDMVCKELGFVNGTFSLGRLAFNGSRHVRLPKPHCLGGEGSILNCKGNTEKGAIQYGGTVCGKWEASVKLMGWGLKVIEIIILSHSLVHLPVCLLFDAYFSLLY